MTEFDFIDGEKGGICAPKVVNNACTVKNPDNYTGKQKVIYDHCYLDCSNNEKCPGESQCWTIVPTKKLFNMKDENEELKLC